MIVEALSYPFFQRALIAGLLASVACGVMGSLVVVRKISSIAGGLSHAAFGGVGLGYLFGFDPLVGALGFGVASAAGLGAAELRMRQGLDTLISIVWAVGMALGIVFVSLAPGQPPDQSIHGQDCQHGNGDGKPQSSASKVGHGQCAGRQPGLQVPQPVPCGHHGSETPHRHHARVEGLECV